MKYFLYLYFIFLVSCSTFSKEECETMNWEKEGYKAALNGQSAGQQARYFQKVCNSKYQVPINGDNFAKGYEQGLKKYCSTSNLYQSGLRGDDYKGICKDPEVGVSYSNGKIKFLEGKISDLEDEVTQLKRENSDLQSKVSSCTGF